MNGKANVSFGSRYTNLEYFDKDGKDVTKTSSLSSTDTVSLTGIQYAIEASAGFGRVENLKFPALAIKGAFSTLNEVKRYH